MKLIPLTDWAEREGIHPSTARHKAARGLLKTAMKIGRDWLIQEEEENLDYRLKENNVKRELQVLKQRLLDQELTVLELSNFLVERGCQDIYDYNLDELVFDDECIAVDGKVLIHFEVLEDLRPDVEFARIRVIEINEL